MKKGNDIWVLIEELPDGKIQDVSIELLTPGRMLADKLGCVLAAVVVGEQTEAMISRIDRYPVDKIIAMDVQIQNDLSEVYTDALEYLITKYQPEGILIGATNSGRDFAPRLSCRLNTGLIADCTGIGIDSQSGRITWTRPTFGGKLMATILCDSFPQMGTVRPGGISETTDGVGKCSCA